MKHQCNITGILPEDNGCTVDCPKCGELCIIINVEVLNFHEYLHSQDERWPKDGAGTGYLGIKE